MPLPEFQSFDKIPRLSRGMVITEKLHGTNSSVLIRVYEPGDEQLAVAIAEAPFDISGATRPTYSMFAGSRNRWLRPTKKEDNYGFAAWVKDNAESLFQMGEGHHHGEWWGPGVKSSYGLRTKRFSLFNTGRWAESNMCLLDGQERAPECCFVVPVLYRGEFNTRVIEETVTRLRVYGSMAAPGFMQPEGVVIWHEAARQMFKKTIHNDEQPKSLATLPRPNAERIADKLLATSAAAWPTPTATAAV
jgi:hypothetical protein